MSTSIDQAEVSAVPAIERRGTPRQPLLQRCLVWPPGAAGTEGWRCIAHNISPQGIGLSLPCPVRPGTILRVEAWGLPGAPVLLARVVFTKPLGFLWLGGCELLFPLDPASLRGWLLGRLDWLP
ncbi:MAG: PilZ domain-containing protein [Planctomycetes bacterium]|nr:PilZ domain-containing protein [Planctomycetota bacterium]